MICHHCGKEIAPGKFYNHVCLPAGEEQAAHLKENDSTLVETLEVVPPELTSEGLPMSCTICGREDETVRFVIYPVVVSFIFITFRRAIMGVWCSRHRFQRQLLASGLTASLGWWGIPFGLFWTPTALYKLVRGGVQSADINADLLKRIAQNKQVQGDIPGAVSALEAREIFLSNTETSTELIHLRSRRLPKEKHTQRSKTLSSMLGLWLGAAVTGTLIGALDYWITILLGLLIGQTGSVFMIILSWIPFVLLAFLGLLFLSGLLNWALRRCCTRNLTMGIFMGLSASVLAVYGVLQGAALSDYLFFALGGYGVVTIDIISVGFAVILGGGLLWLESLLGSAFLPNQIYLILLTSIMIFYMANSVLSARDIVYWQRKIQPV